MNTYLEVGVSLWPVGTPDFFNAYFSTVAANLEPDGWGSRFPGAMQQLYSGEVSPDTARDIREELIVIRRELADHPVRDLVWDFEDRAARPPWGEEISADITSMADYFVTMDGRDLFDVLLAALEECEQTGDALHLIAEETSVDRELHAQE